MNEATVYLIFAATIGLTGHTGYMLHKLLRGYRLPLPEVEADEPARAALGGNSHQRRIARRAEKRRTRLAAG